MSVNVDYIFLCVRCAHITGNANALCMHRFISVVVLNTCLTLFIRCIFVTPWEIVDWIDWCTPSRTDRPFSRIQHHSRCGHRWEYGLMFHGLFMPVYDQQINTVQTSAKTNIDHRSSSCAALKSHFHANNIKRSKFLFGIAMISYKRNIFFNSKTHPLPAILLVWSVESA